MDLRQEKCRSIIQNISLFSDEEQSEAKSTVGHVEEEAEEVTSAKRRKRNVTGGEAMAQILEMHKREHELRMKYIHEEHEMKVEEHRVKMEILNRKKTQLDGTNWTCLKK